MLRTENKILLTAIACEETLLYMLPIVGDDSNFEKAAPLLFSTEFAKKGKEMVEQVRAMRSTISKKQERKPPFFRRGPP